MNLRKGTKKRPMDMVCPAEMCGTCPFRPGSPYSNLAADLAAHALEKGSRICHATGSNAINRNTGRPPALCRGARNVQIAHYHAIGYIEAPTDEAWEKKCRELGIIK